MSEDTDQSQKTEEPTQKRLDEAEEHGDVAQSADVVAFAILTTATVMILTFGASSAAGLAQSLSRYFSESGQLTLNAERMNGLFAAISWQAVTYLALPFAAILAVAIGAHLIQRPWIFTPEKLAPKFERVSPVSGFNRIFGRQGLIQFLKGLVKLSAVGAVAAWVLWGGIGTLPGLVERTPASGLSRILELFEALMIGTLIVYGIIAGLDFGWQAWERRQRLMMTRQEIQDEFKQSEGDPHVKARLKQIRSDRARKRMMAAVPKATVVITNPTHYAVALAYESGRSAAPVVVAKGLDLVALKIREIAQAHRVPVVENPPLARTLYATVDIDEAIKPEHYKAVAHVIGYVMKLKSKGKQTS